MKIKKSSWSYRFFKYMKHSLKDQGPLPDTIGEYLFTLTRYVLSLIAFFMFLNLFLGMLILPLLSLTVGVEEVKVIANKLSFFGLLFIFGLIGQGLLWVGYFIKKKIEPFLKIPVDFE